MIAISETARMALELTRVLAVSLLVEIGRRLWGPRPLVEGLRKLGRHMPERDSPGRNRLQRAIGWVDACFLGPRSCYRRSLLEISLDRDAAAEPFWMGLKADGDPVSGHAWLGSRRGTEERYEVEIEL